MHFLARYQSSNNAWKRNNLPEWSTSFYSNQAYQDSLRKNHGRIYPYTGEAVKTKWFHQYLLWVLIVVPFWKQAWAVLLDPKLRPCLDGLQVYVGLDPSLSSCILVIVLSYSSRIIGLLYHSWGVRFTIRAIVLLSSSFFVYLMLMSLIIRG